MMRVIRPVGRAIGRPLGLATGREVDREVDRDTAQASLRNPPVRRGEMNLKKVARRAPVSSCARPVINPSPRPLQPAPSGGKL